MIRVDSILHPIESLWYTGAVPGTRHHTERTGQSLRHFTEHDQAHIDENSIEYGAVTNNAFSIRKCRIIEWFSSGGTFSRLRTAKIEGYLAGNRDFCRQQAADIHPLMSREHGAVVP